MNEIGAFQAKNTLGSLLDRVERGEEIVITRHGKPVARLVPAEQKRLQRHRDAVERILNLPKVDLGDDSLKSLIAEGRKR